MHLIRRLRLVSSENSAYQNFLQYVIAMKRLRVRRPQEFTRESISSNTEEIRCLSLTAERLVRKWIDGSTSLHPFRILTYEKFQQEDQRYIRQYREIDALFQEPSTHDWVVAEVKFSQNVQAVAVANRQLRQTISVLKASGWQTQPLIIWVNTNAKANISPYPTHPFQTNFGSICQKALTKEGIPVICIACDALFQWGVRKGWIPSTELDRLTHLFKQVRSDENLITNSQSSSTMGLLATKLTAALQKKLA